MNLNDYYSRSLTEAKTTSIKGHILESNDKFIIIEPCFCVHHDPPNNPCKCMESTKLIIDKSDIIGDIVTVTSEEKETLSSFLVNVDANIIREEQTIVKASNLGAIAFPIGPIIALLCKLYPEHCKGKGEDKKVMALSSLSHNMPIGIPDTIKDYLCKVFPEFCRGKGDGKPGDGVVYIAPAVLYGLFTFAGFLGAKIIDALDEDCTTTTTESVGSDGTRTTTTVKTCK